MLNSFQQTNRGSRAIFLWFRPIYHFCIAVWSAIFFGFPSKKMVVIGITGTNGKSTTVALLHEIFLNAGLRVCSASSLRFKIGHEERQNTFKMTMVGRGFLQKFLREGVRKKCQYAIIEVTSEGIKQFRHLGINFDIALLTNLAPEHIESHGSFEAYRDTKRKLFESVANSSRKSIHGIKIQKTAILNLDNPFYEHFMIPGLDLIIGYTKEGRADKQMSHVYKGEHSELRNSGGVRFSVDGMDIQSELSGKFNISNMLAAIAVSRYVQIAPSVIQKTLQDAKNIPGRFERIVMGQPFSVIVDYAHTPDALVEVYETASKENANLICVLGAAGGGRDTWKRREFGKIASTYCKHIILTNEDPYDEDPEKILDDIKEGVISDKNVEKILDRKSAIEHALHSARLGDAVIVTGKGAEPWMVVADGKKIPWDDRAITRSVLEKLKNIPSELATSSETIKN